MTFTPDQLHHAIESHLPPADGDLSLLVRLAGRLRFLEPPGPSVEASGRMTARFESVIAGEPQRFLDGWSAPAGVRPTLAQCFAGGALLLSALGGATSVATGVSPSEATGATVRFVAHTVRNLAPHASVEPLAKWPAIPPDQGVINPSVTSEAAAQPNGSASGAGSPPSTPLPKAAAPTGPATSGTAPATATPTAPSSRTPTPSPTPFVADPTQRPTATTPPPATPQPSQSAAASAPAVSKPPPTSTPMPSSGPTGTPSVTPSTSPSPSSTPTATPTPDDTHEDQADELEMEN